MAENETDIPKKHVPPNPDDPEWQRRAVELYERTVTHNPFIPKEHLKDSKPHPKQQRFLLLSDFQEVFFGGSAGGGKSSGLLLAALQFVQTPGYAALLLRQSFRDLNQPDALIPLSKKWLKGYEKWGVGYHERDRRWTFPSGATITFGYLDRPDDVYQYQGAAFQMIGFDELTQFEEFSYRYLFSRLRRTDNTDAPLRIRATSNPGGKGHEWVRKRFVDPSTREPGVIFVPAGLTDNPSLDAENYTQALSHLDPITRRQLLEGDWDAYQGGRFQLDWFKNGRWKFDGRAFHLSGAGMEAGEGIAAQHCALYVTVDLAASAKTSADYTVFLAGALTPWRQLLVLDMERKQHPIEQIPVKLRDFCDRLQRRFGQPVMWAGVEANNMQVGVAAQCRLLPGMAPVKYLTPGNQDKLARATPAIIAAEQGHIFVPLHAPWLEVFLYELAQFTGDPKKDAHDDVVDALSYMVMNMGFVSYEPPTAQKAAERQGRDPTRIWKRAGRMNRLFGNR